MLIKAIKLFITIISFFVVYNATIEAQQSSRLGGCFTPKDSIKVLFVFVGYGSNDALYDTWAWHKDSLFPYAVYDNKLFYTDFAMFDDTVTIDEERDINNISRWYFEQSKLSGHPLKLIAGAVRVNVVGNPNNYPSYNNNILDSLSKFHNDPNHPFNFADYDNRKNNPNYLNDYSKYDVPVLDRDKIIDYVAVIYRSNPPITHTAETPGMTGTRDGYSFSHGYIQYKPDRNLFWCFVHEVGHKLLKDVGHNGAANTGVIANNFYTNSGMWSLMNLGQWHPFNVSNGWEKYMLGWIPEIEAYNTSSKLSYPLVQDYQFTLRDFDISGDVIVIEIPSDTNGGKQRMWLENHQVTTTFDNKDWDTIIASTGLIIPPSTQSLYAYIDDMTGSIELLLGLLRMLLPIYIQQGI